MNYRILYATLAFAAVWAGCAKPNAPQATVATSGAAIAQKETNLPMETEKNATQAKTAPASERDQRTEAEWKKTLTADQYSVLREEGTERAFTGEYWNHHEKGTYECAGCGQALFAQDAKFDSGTGWPSFWQPIAKRSIHEAEDRSLGMARTEVECSRCGGHLGHVFEDGPKPTGLRYCINSVSLRFKPEGKK